MTRHVRAHNTAVQRQTLCGRPIVYPSSVPPRPANPAGGVLWNDDVVEGIDPSVDCDACRRVAIWNGIAALSGKGACAPNAGSRAGEVTPSMNALFFWCLACGRVADERAGVWVHAHAEKR